MPDVKLTVAQALDIMVKCYGMRCHEVETIRRASKFSLDQGTTIKTVVRFDDGTGRYFEMVL